MWYSGECVGFLGDDSAGSNIMSPKPSMGTRLVVCRIDRDCSTGAQRNLEGSADEKDVATRIHASPMAQPEAG